MWLQCDALDDDGGYIGAGENSRLRSFYRCILELYGCQHQWIAVDVMIWTGAGVVAAAVIEASVLMIKSNLLCNPKFVVRTGHIEWIVSGRSYWCRRGESCVWRTLSSLWWSS